MKIVRLVFLVALLGCASQARTIPGTKVTDTRENREIIKVLERYRLAMERQDAPALLAMASRNYWEDGGTPTGGDDYGYDGLREVLLKRFPKVDSVRYSMRYMDIQREGNRALVEVLIDASYTIQTEQGPQRYDMREQNQIVLEWDGSRWLFLSGM